MAHTKPETLVSCTRIYHYHNVLCYFPTASIFVSEASAVVIAAKGNELRRQRAGPQPLWAARPRPQHWLFDESWKVCEWAGRIRVQLFFAWKRACAHSKSRDVASDAFRGFIPIWRFGLLRLFSQLCLLNRYEFLDYIRTHILVMDWIPKTWVSGFGSCHHHG